MQPMLQSVWHFGNKSKAVYLYQSLSFITWLQKTDLCTKKKSFFQIQTLLLQTQLFLPLYCAVKKKHGLKQKKLHQCCNSQAQSCHYYPVFKYSSLYPNKGVISTLPINHGCAARRLLKWGRWLEMKFITSYTNEQNPQTLEYTSFACKHVSAE